MKDSILPGDLVRSTHTGDVFLSDRKECPATRWTASIRNTDVCLVLAVFNFELTKSHLCQRCFIMRVAPMGFGWVWSNFIELHERLENAHE